MMNARKWLPLLLLAAVAGKPSLAGLNDASSVGARDLTFEQRVAAQEAIEQVYWSHTIWPKENPRPKPPLEEIMPDAVLRAKVTDYLEKSVALDTWWKRPIAAEQLQTEMARMADNTRDPEVLRELFAALGNDPELITETLARQTLVDRLIRNWYAYDAGFHGATRERAERALAGRNDAADLKTLGGEYHETLWVRSQGSLDRTSTKNEIHIDAESWAENVAQLRERFDGRNATGTLPVNTISPLKETPNEFSVVMVLESTPDRVRVASVIWAKTSFDVWWKSQAPTLEAGGLATVAPPEGGYVAPMIPQSACTPDTWRPTKFEVPDARQQHTAIWTGTEMIIWGGATDSVGNPCNTGGRYSPATDTWTATSNGTNTPSARHSHTAVWTGTEMIVWGGLDQSSANTGGRYSPATDTWTPTSTGTNLPSARYTHTAVWTGAEMIVWGGHDNLADMNTGGRYTPLTDSWVATSTGANVPSARANHAAVWTGTEMIVWGGSNLNTGARYSPATDTWTATSIGTNVPSARRQHTAIWTGTQMIVWGGIGSSGLALNTGGRYTPTTNTWTVTPGPGPGARYGHTAIWTGTQMIVWGGLNDAGGTNTGGRYTPSTNAWLLTSAGPSARYGHTAIWTATEMIVWGGFSADLVIKTGGRYSPSTNTWIATATATNTPSEHVRHSAVWTGTQMIVWGGANNSGFLNTGGRYSPATDTWTPTSTGTNLPSARFRHTAVWTGAEMIVWGGYDNLADMNTGGRYTPMTDSWVATSTGANVPSARENHTAVWTGTEMIVWGGSHDPSILNTGARYSPATNTWTATSTGTNVPGRYNHTAVWTGTEMIVWGGYDVGQFGSQVNTGGRYEPTTDTWRPTSVAAGVPSGRDGHTAIWTGTEMIVWGGGLGSTGTNTGGRYSPSTDSWVATSDINVPSARFGSTAVWTGTEMIVWGGSGFNNTGGRYSPARNGWAATSTGTNVPSARYLSTAVWTGAEMIVWGGGPPTATGGLYCVDVCAPSVCDDGNSCTDDSCNPATGCVFTNNTNACNDNNACTANDACANGVCAGEPPPACDDGNACTTNICNTGTGQCENPAIVCNDNNTCTDDSCNPATGCVYSANNNNTCTDNSLCTAIDLCQTGVCVGQNPVVCTPDANVCTTEACNPATGSCASTNNTNACDDGNACTTGDVCGPTFSANFDGVTAPGLPGTWTSTVTGTGNPWATVSTSSDTAPNSAFGFDGPAVADEVLISPPINIATASAQLTFRNRWSFESATSCYDAGVLEIAIGGGAFTDIVTAGGSFVSGGYTGTVSSGYSNPLAARPAWCKASAGYPAYLTTVVNLPAVAAGQTIQLQWRIGTDTSVGAAGQNIDSIVVLDGANFCHPGAVITAPPETLNVTVAADKATYSWSAAAFATQYDVVRGATGALPVGPGGGDEVCFDNLAGPTLSDPALPDPGTGFWYLSRGENACGIGTFGTQGVHGAPGLPRATTTCP